MHLQGCSEAFLSLVRVLKEQGRLSQNAVIEYAKCIISATVPVLMQINENVSCSLHFYYCLCKQFVFRTAAVFLILLTGGLSYNRSVVWTIFRGFFLGGGGVEAEMGDLTEGRTSIARRRE